MSERLKVSRRGPAIPLTSNESVTGTVSGDDIDWTTSPIGASVSAKDQWKQPCHFATTGNITIATGLNAGDVIDGVTLVNGMRGLVKDQSTGSQNGIYIVGASPERAPDFDDDDEVLGAVVYVIDGTANGGTAWAVTNIAATIVDTDDIDWAAFGGGSIADILDLPTVETDTSLVLAPDGLGGVEFRAETGGGDTVGQLAGGFDGAGAAITADSLFYGTVPFTGTIVAWTILGHNEGSPADAAFDVAVGSAGSLPAFPGDSIVAAAPPSMTADTDATSSSLSGWSTAVTAGDRYAVRFASGDATWALLILDYSRP